MERGEGRKPHIAPCPRGMRNGLRQSERHWILPGDGVKARKSLELFFVRSRAGLPLVIESTRLSSARVSIGFMATIS